MITHHASPLAGRATRALEFWRATSAGTLKPFGDHLDAVVSSLLASSLSSSFLDMSACSGGAVLGASTAALHGRAYQQKHSTRFYFSAAATGSSTGSAIVFLNK